MTDETPGTNEITQKELGKKYGQRKPALRKERHEDKPVIRTYFG